MKKRWCCNKLKFIYTFFFVIALVFSTVPAFASQYATDYCVVYDNSGSTYKDETLSRYTYALEVMAHLVDFKKGDRIFIYPLCRVNIDGQEYGGENEPIEISSYEDISKISNMQHFGGATPFEPVERAYRFLSEVSAAEDKKLLIMTDGMFDDALSADELENKLAQMSIDRIIQVYYFCSGNAVSIATFEDIGLYSSCYPNLVDPQRLIDFISNCCDVESISTETFNIDSQMLKLDLRDNTRVIVFANGEDATVLGLSDKNSAQKLLLHNKYKQDNFGNAPVDNQLECYIAIFEGKAGAHTLYFDNTTQVRVFVQEIVEADFESIIRNQTNRRPFGIDNTDSEANQGSGSTTNFIYVIVFIAVFLIVLISVYCLKRALKIIVDLKKRKGKYQIFISYRRDGGEALAGRLADRFRFKGYEPFFDVESMRAGTFNTQILDAIAECSDFLLVLPPGALDRCVNEDDWVRQELAFALSNGKRIIPVMMKGFEFPTSLPSDIDEVRFYQGVEASQAHFESVIDQIESYLICRKRRSKFRRK